MNVCRHCQNEFSETYLECPVCHTPTSATIEGTRAGFYSQVIGNRYVIEKLIGEGSVGRIYKGKDLEAQRAVAIKILHRHLNKDAGIVKRFQREAMLLRQIQHPNIVRLYDFGETAQQELFMVMEFLLGRSLRTVIEDDFPLPTPRILRIFVQLCDILAQCHNHGWIHRDLKPENIFLMASEAGESPELVKLLDLGIVKIFEEGGVDKLTVEGTICGTPVYMSPEQCQGAKDIDNRSDLYSLGIILYEMLTRQVPYYSNNLVKLIYQKLSGIPLPPSAAFPAGGILKGLEDIVLKAIRPERELRYPSCEALKNDLVRLSIR